MTQKQYSKRKKNYIDENLLMRKKKKNNENYELVFKNIFIQKGIFIYLPLILKIHRITSKAH